MYFQALARMLALSLSSFVLGGAAFANTDPGNLILRVWGSNPAVLKSRITAAAQAVGPDGKLILDYSKTTGGESDLLLNPDELIQSLPKSLRPRVLLVSSSETYEFPRDTSRGWGKTAEGKHRLYGRRGGNEVLGPDGKMLQSHSTLGIAALLNSCKSDDYAFPSLSSYSSQGGEIVTNGNGLCIVNSNILTTDKTSRDFEEHLTALGCKEMISATSAYRWRDLGLMNGHVDFSALFVGPRTVLIPSVDETCPAEIKTEFKKEWATLKQSLLDKKIDVIETPLAGGCIEKNPQTASGPGSRYIRSYSNAVVLKSAILLPEFVGETAEDAKKFASYNRRAQETLRQLMSQGKIPRRKVIGFPIDDAPLRGGAAVRCMSLEIPGRIHGCSQDRLNQALHQLLSSTDQTVERLKSNLSTESCHTIQHLYQTLRFLHGEPARQRVMKTSDGKRIQVLASSQERLAKSMESLKGILGKCP